MITTEIEQFMGSRYNENNNIQNGMSVPWLVSCYLIPVLILISLAVYLLNGNNESANH